MINVIMLVLRRSRSVKPTKSNVMDMKSTAVYDKGGDVTGAFFSKNISGKGICLVELKQHGRWKSTVCERYVSNTICKKMKTTDMTK